jgi:hypothetical protein
MVTVTFTADVIVLGKVLTNRFKCFHVDLQQEIHLKNLKREAKEEAEKEEASK